MSDEDLKKIVDELSEQVKELRAEAAIRRVQSRYMFLCDTPCPEAGIEDDEERIRLIVDLYTDDGIWEGVGPFYDNQFGRSVGKDAIRKHFQGFWSEKRDPALLFNVHYLTSEYIEVDGEEATGQWVHCQPWIFSDGTSLLRSSRLNNRFRCVDGTWKIARTRTENVFVAPLKQGWAESFVERSVLMSL